MSTGDSRNEPDFGVPDSEVESGRQRTDGIAQRAFEKWTARGQPTGTSLSDWHEAEEELRELLVLTRRVQGLERRFTDQLSEIKQARRQHLAEHDVVCVLSASVTLDEAAPRILRSVCEHLEYGLGAFWLVDQVSGVLRCAEAFDCTGFDIDANSTAILGQSFGFGEGLPGRVWAGHVAASMTNPSSPHETAETSMAERSAIAFPIRNGAEFLGVMEFVSRDRRDEDHGIVRTMAAIGRQVNQFIMRCDRTALLKGTHSMQHSKLLIVAMAEQCESIIQLGQTPDGALPAALRARHLLMMCKLIKQHVEDWPDTKLHRWIGFVQAGMMANRMLDLAGAKAMFDDAKQAYGNPDDDPDLIDHLDPGSSFEMELGGQG